MCREDDEESVMISHLSSEEKKETAIETTISEAVTPLKFPNKEEMEIDFASMTEEDGIKEELVLRSNLEEFISQTKPMLREKDEESYEEVVTVS